jgi:hypothetical protein
LLVLSIVLAGCAKQQAAPPPPPPPPPAVAEVQKPPAPSTDPQKAADAAADARAAAQTLAQQVTELKGAIAQNAQTMESVKQLAQNNATIAGATDAAQKAQAAANDARATVAAASDAAAKAMNDLQQQTDQLRHERAQAEQAARARINTIPPGKRKTLADYIPCRFNNDDEYWFRLGYADGGSTPEDAASLKQTGDKYSKNTPAFMTLRRENSALSASAFAALAVQQNVVDPAKQDAVAADLAAAKPSVPSQGDVSCSQSMLSWKETDLIFGRAVANNYVAVEVNARNLNDTEEFLLHDVQVAVADVNNHGQLICPASVDAPRNPNADPNPCVVSSHFVSGRDKLLARGVLVSGKAESPRNIAANIIDVAASVLSATSGVLGTTVLNAAGASVASSGRMNLSNFVHVFSAVALPGFNKIFPDNTVDQLNRLNDVGFSANSAYKILIPKGGSVPFVTFVSAKIFADSYKTWTSEQLRTFQENMVVVVAGKHIVEANDAIQVNTMDCPKTTPGGYLDLSKADSDNFSCDIAGDNLAKAGSVQLQNSAGSDPKTVDGKVTVSGSSSKVVFSAAALKALTGANYTLFVPDSSGKLASTTIHVSLPPVVASIDPTTLALSGCTAPDCTITLKGTNLDLIGKVVLKAKDGDSTASGLAGTLGTTSNGTRTATFPLTGLKAQTDPYRLQVITTDGAEILPTTALTIK